MSSSKPGGRRFKRGWDYVQQIANTLEGLAGGGALAHELIQNADDAGAKSITFRFTPKALEVHDDAGFKVCGSPDDPKCSLAETGRMCDFHAFNSLGSASKAKDPDSTGAFGVGFLAVYQVTDRPEVLSAGIHVAIDEEAQESVECLGCDRPHIRKGTQIVLPWARSPSSLRRSLTAEAVSSHDCERLRKEFLEAIPRAMLFLRHVREIHLEWAKGAKSFRRSARDGQVTIAGASKSVRWTILEGSFDNEAEALRRAHPQIGDRHARIRIALKPEAKVSGRLFATLPTQVTTGLPVHIDASFYPKVDRKGIRLDGGFRSDWNEAAIRAVAAQLASEIKVVAKVLGPEPFWHLVHVAHRLSTQASADTRALAPIWADLQKVLPTAEVMWTSADTWEVVEKTVLAPPTKEQARLLEDLQIPTVSSRVRPLVPWKPLGLGRVSLQHLVDGLQRAQTAHSVDGYPPAWQSRKQRQALQRLLAELARIGDLDSEGELAAQIGELEIWETLEGNPASFDSAYIAPRDCAGAFRDLSDYPFVEWGSRTLPALAAIGDRYELDQAVSDMERADLHRLDDRQLMRVLRWLNKKAKDLSDEQIEKLRHLPLFPTAVGRSTAQESIRPGGFDDKLGLAGVLRKQDLKGIEAIAQSLGVRKLNFSTYLSQHVARAASAGDLDPKQCMALLRMCARNVDALDRDADLGKLLSGLECVPCKDGEIHAPTQAYFDFKAVRAVLGPDAPLAADGIKSKSGVGDLLSRLGVASEPRPEDVIVRVKEAVSVAPTRLRVTVVRAVIDHLRKRPRQVEKGDEWEELRGSNWLPSTDPERGWMKPDQLHLVRHRKLFPTAGTFLGIPKAQQDRCRAALVALGVREQPSLDLVIEHVGNLAEAGTPPTPQILKWLNTRSDDEAIEDLRLLKFLPDADGALYEPSEIFRSRHQLEPWLPVLSLRGVRPDKLLAALGVLARPNGEHAVEVLTRAASNFGEGATPDEVAHRVIRAAWRLITGPPETDVARLLELPVVLDSQGRLRKPTDVLINDRPPIAAKLGEGAEDVLIPREPYLEEGLRRAGVSLLSQKLRTSIVNRRRGRSDSATERHIRGRQVPLARVVRDGRGDSTTLVEFLGGVRVLVLSPLSLRYSIVGLPGATDSEAVGVPSYLDRTDLFVEAGNGRPDWAAIANSLRDGLMPEAGAGGALAIREVLLAADGIEAGRILDDVGCDRLSAQELESLRSEIEQWEARRSPEEDLGEPERDEEQVPIDDEDETISWAEDDEPDAGTPWTGAGTGSGAGDVGELRQPRGDADGSSVAAHTSGQARDGGGGSSDSSGPDRQGREGSGSDPDRRLETRVYVVGAEEPDPSATANGGGRSQMGEDGVDLVVVRLKDELVGSGHRVEKMPNNQKGYDLRVKDDGGYVVRYIEVKSTEDRWAGRGVAVSAPQFELASKEGERYWLYVVEHLYEPEAFVYAIPDPARLVNDFIYDSGWKELAAEQVQIAGAARR